MERGGFPQLHLHNNVHVHAHSTKYGKANLVEVKGLRLFEMFWLPVQQSQAVMDPLASGPEHTPKSVLSPGHSSVRVVINKGMPNATTECHRTCMSSLVSEADSASLVRISLNMAGLRGS